MRFWSRAVLLCLLIETIVASDLAYAGVSQTKPPFPESFASSAEAIKAGCKVIRLKSPHLKSLMLTGWDQRETIIAIYDPAPDGRIRKAHEIRITSWYGFATASISDWLKNRTDFILVEFEGNTGTGTLQMILTAFGWDGRKLLPVLMETISYTNCFDLDDYAELKNRFSIKYAKTGEPMFVAKYDLTTDATKKPTHAYWTDALVWDRNLFAFRFAANQSSKPSTTYGAKVRNSIQETRKRLLQTRPTNEEIIIDDDYLHKIRIMAILDRD